MSPISVDSPLVRPSARCHTGAIVNNNDSHSLSRSPVSGDSEIKVETLSARGALRALAQ
jgi:hypothetical protein